MEPFRRLHGDGKAGLYSTVIVHLAALIVLLAVNIGYTVQKESSFVLDFSKLEEKEQIEREIQLQEAILSQIEEMLEASGQAPLRNVRVNAARAALQDDRNTDAEQLYRDAERLAKELRDGQKVKREDPEDYVQEQRPVRRQEEARPYSGPSVLSWSLDGREAVRLPIPAYRCYGAGQVTVLITVNGQGDVVSARIHEEGSVYDDCLRNFALRAARMSKFSTSDTAPARQIGTIVYSFIAQ